jgi:PKHD-type hydroxylase
MSWSIEVDNVEPFGFMPGAFSLEECKKIIDLGNSLEQIEGSLDVGNINYSIRQSKVSWITQSEVSRWIFERLVTYIYQANKSWFNFDLWGLAEDLQFTRYDVGSVHQAHVDLAYKQMIRKLSVIIQLSDPSEYEGGDLNIMYQPKPVTLTKDLGSVIFFPSYTLHEVTPVTKGQRYSLVSWVTGNQFK